SNGIVVDAARDAIITGSLGITPDNHQAIVVKALAAGGLDYYLLKGSGYDAGLGIALGNIDTGYVVGGTTSEDFPVTEDALQAYCGGGPSDAGGGLFGID